MIGVRSSLLHYSSLFVLPSCASTISKLRRLSAWKIFAGFLGCHSCQHLPTFPRCPQLTCAQRGIVLERLLRAGSGAPRHAGPELVDVQPWHEMTVSLPVFLCSRCIATNKNTQEHGKDTKDRNANGFQDVSRVSQSDRCRPAVALLSPRQHPMA